MFKIVCAFEERMIIFCLQKLDRQTWYSDGILGEPVFIPRESEEELEEDDGYVLVQLYKLKEHRTEFVLLNAKNITQGPICRISLPHHLPFGFHGNFTREFVLNWKKFEKSFL